MGSSVEVSAMNGAQFCGKCLGMHVSSGSMSVWSCDGTWSMIHIYIYIYIYKYEAHKEEEVALALK